ncbi:hypothetical protein [Vallitalea okinawensis]|uniref:hypothetical protein n=1 Tax=Vallitalea okinawensis TaxID=2078660 RepID=UPI000CFCD853|nr:hypothetical protein [Vallitalea okinawensis]
MNEWTEAIWLGVSALITAMVLSFATMLGASVRHVSRIQQEEINAIEIVKEHRKYNKYDGTSVYPQDIVSLVLETRGNPAVWVDDEDNTNVNYIYMWDTTLPKENWQASYFTSLLPLTGSYESSLVKDANGAVLRFEFRRE